MTNFLCYSQNLPTLELEGIQLACISGDNGHGKTALLDAITWALWGEARARTQEELIHQGQLEMVVELEFMARNIRHKVIRRHSKSARSKQGSTILELYLLSNNTFQPITGNTIRETDNYIRNLLQMDYGTFTSSAFLMQGQADKFTSATPSERKRILGEILDLGFYDSLESKAKEHSRIQFQEIQKLEINLQTMSEQLGRQERYETELKEFTTIIDILTPQISDIQIQIEKLQDNIRSLNNKIGEVKTLERQITLHKQEINHFERQIRDSAKAIDQYKYILQKSEEGAISKAEQDLKEIEDFWNNLKEPYKVIHQIESNINEKKAENNKLKFDGKDIRTKLNLLASEEALCPVCNKPLGSDGIIHLKSELETTIQKHKLIYEENEINIQQLTTKKDQLLYKVTKEEKELLQKRQETNLKLATLKRDIQHANDSFKVESSRLNQTQAILDGRKTELIQNIDLLNTLTKDLTDHPNREQELKNMQSKLHQLSQQQLQSMTNQGILEQKIKDCKELAVTANEKTSSIIALQKEKSIYDELIVAFGKSGVQALIIESAIPNLQDDANELLAKLTANQMSLTLETQRERKTKQGEAIETLEIKIGDDLGTRSYDTFSGGETFRVNFALRIALSKLLARRAGAPLPILFIDEGFGTQDATGRERLLQAIKSIESKFEKIFVITHIDDLKEAFPVRIEVTKSEYGSSYIVV